MEVKDEQNQDMIHGVYQLWCVCFKSWEVIGVTFKLIIVCVVKNIYSKDGIKSVAVTGSFRDLPQVNAAMPIAL